MELEKGFVLGKWLVEPSLNRISSNQQQVTLEPQAMDVLCLLAQQAGQVVPTDEIVRIAWAGRPISDNPVYKIINKLRRALGDNPRAPIYVETLTKRGYRLIAEVTPVPTPQESVPTAGRSNLVAQPADGLADQGSEQGSEQLHRQPPPTATRKRTFITTGLIALVFLALGAAWLTQQPVHKTLLPQTSPLLSLPGSSSQASIALDGQVAFVNDSTGIAQLWRLPASGTNPIQLTFGDTPSDAPSWSPRDGHLLFTRGSDIWRLMTDASEQLLIRNGRNGTYSQDGLQIAFERGGEVWLSRADGNGQQRVTAIQDHNQFFAYKRPTFSPDGTHLVYFQAEEGPFGDVWSVNLNSGQITQLTFDRTHAGYPVYSADGQWVIFQSARSGPLTLWRVPSDGGTVEALLSSAGDDSEPAASPDGKSIVYTSTRERWSLLRLDPVSGRNEVLYDSRTSVFAPELSPNGKQLAFFATNTQRNTRVLLLNLEGREVRQLDGQPGSVNIMPKWSSNGDWIYYYQANNTPAWRRVSADGATDELIFNEWNFNEEHDTTIHPGGDQAIYARLSGNEVVAAQIKDIGSGSELPFPRRVTWVEWSADGKSLVATEFSGQPLPVGQVLMCTQAALEDWQCLQIATHGQHPVWGPQEASIYYAQPLDSSRMNIWRYDIASGATNLIQELSPLAVDIGPFFDVDSSGRIFWVKHEAGRSELWRLSGIQ